MFFTPLTIKFGSPLKHLKSRIYIIPIEEFESSKSDDINQLHPMKTSYEQAPVVLQQLRLHSRLTSGGKLTILSDNWR